MPYSPFIHTDTRLDSLKTLYITSRFQFYVAFRWLKDKYKCTLHSSQGILILTLAYPSLLLPLPCTLCFSHTQFLTGPEIHWAFSNGDCTHAAFFVWRVLTFLIPFFKLLTILCPTPVIPWTVACQAPLSMGFSRQEYWSGLPFPSPGESSRPMNWTQVSRFAGRCFTNWAMRCFYLLSFPERSWLWFPLLPPLVVHGMKLTGFSVSCLSLSRCIFFSNSHTWFFILNLVLFIFLTNF